MIVDYNVASRSPIGAVTPAAKIQLVPAPGSGYLRLLSIQLSYADTGTAYLQIHDALAADVSSDTMVLPFGILMDASTAIAQIVSWQLWEAPVFTKAVTLAASSTSLTYTASTKLFVAKGIWQ